MKNSMIALASLLIGALCAEQSALGLPFNDGDLDIDFSGTVAGNPWELTAEDTDLEFYTGVKEGEGTKQDFTIVFFLDLYRWSESRTTFLDITDLLNGAGDNNTDPGATGAGTFTLNSAAQGNKPEPDVQIGS